MITQLLVVLIQIKLLIMAIFESGDGLLLELDDLVLLDDCSRACNSTLLLLRLLLMSLLLESSVLCRNLGKLICLLVKLLLQGHPLPLQVEAVILLHVVLLLEDEQVLTLVI